MTEDFELPIPPDRMDVYVEGRHEQRDIEALSQNGPLPRLRSGEEIYRTVSGEIHIIQTGR